MSVERLIALEGIVGSHAYGTATPKSDVDYFGVVIEAPRHGIGFATKDSWVRHGEIDSTLHTLRKFCGLALKGNPSVLEMLFLPSYTTKTTIGDQLLQMAPSFASTRATTAFLGYMRQQRERLEGTRGQKNVTRSALVQAHGWDTKYGAHIIRLGTEGLEYTQTGRITLPLPNADFIKDIRSGVYDKDIVIDVAITLEHAMKAAEKASHLPPSPDVESVERWMVRTYLDVWRGWRY